MSILHKSTRYESQEIYEKKIPVLFNEKENCCGCSACYAVCPLNAISMDPDEEGFLYPVIDVTKCIQCYKCIKVCSFKEDQFRKGFIEMEKR